MQQTYIERLPRDLQRELTKYNEGVWFQIAKSEDPQDLEICNVTFLKLGLPLIVIPNIIANYGSWILFLDDEPPETITYAIISKGSIRRKEGHMRLTQGTNYVDIPDALTEIFRRKIARAILDTCTSLRPGDIERVSLFANT